VLGRIRRLLYIDVGAFLSHMNGLIVIFWIHTHPRAVFFSFHLFAILRTRQNMYVYVRAFSRWRVETILCFRSDEV
jgi:hypothetical protein